MPWIRSGAAAVAVLLAACGGYDSAAPRDPVTLVEVSPLQPGVSPGDTLHFKVAILTRIGRVFDRPVTWTSSNPSVASVTDSGVVTGVAAGTSAIRAESEGVADEVTLLVSNAFSAVSVGDRSTCGLSPSGAAYCWGFSLTGRLGWQGANDTAGPVPVSGGHAWTRLVTRSAHSCAIDGAGAAWCWGSNFYGELDNSPPNSNNLSYVPLPVGNGTAYVGLAASDNYSCGLDANGQVYCWGFACGNDQVSGFFCWGSGPNSPMASPAPLAAIAAGFAHMCGISPAGQSYCWGENGSGQLGVSGAPGSATPLPVQLPNPARLVAAGARFSCALTTQDDLFCWGDNSSGQLGIGNTSQRSSPTLVEGNHKWSTLAAGGHSACGRTLDGTTYCWGILGNGTSSPSPRAITSGYAFDRLSVENGVACGHTAGGGLYCWGSGNYGQLGTGSRANTLTPRRVLDP